MNTNQSHPIVLIAAALLSVVAADPGKAQVSFSGTSGNWTNTATWTGGLIPGAGTNVVMAGGGQIGVSSAVSAQSISMSNASGNADLNISNGGSLSVVGAITDPGAGTARAFLANNTAADAATRLTATSVALANFTLRNAGGTTNYLSTGFDMTIVTQMQLGESGTTGGALYTQTGGNISVGSSSFGLTIGEGATSSNASGLVSYDLNGGTLQALRIGAANGNGTSVAGSQRYLNGTNHFNFNAGTLQNQGSSTTLTLQNGFANSGTATNTMGWNTATATLFRLSDSGANIFNANGVGSLIIVSPSVRVVDQTGEAGTITKTGVGDLVFAGGNTANSNTWSGATTVSNGNVVVDYNRIAGEAATGGSDSLANAYSASSQLVLNGGGFTLTGRGSASAGSLTNVTLSNNSTSVGVATTNGLVIGQAVSNANLPAGTYIRRLINATTIELSSFPTAAVAGQTLGLGAATFANTQVVNDVVLQAASNTVTVNPGSGSSTTLLTFSNFSGSGSLNKAGTGTLALAPGAGVTNTLTGNLTGSAGTIAKSGAGHVILGTTNSAGNTFSGAIAVNEGTLQIGNATSANNNSQRLTAASSATVASGATLLYKNSSALPSSTAITLAGLLTTDVTGVSGGGFHNVLGALTLSNGGELRANQGGNASNFQAFALNGTVTVTGTSAATITTASTPSGGDGIHLANNAATNRTFNVADVTGDANADLTVSARLINAANGNQAAGIIKEGPGSMVLAGSNSYTGITVVSNGQVELATNGWLRFVIGATGENNAVSGAGSAFFRGNFLFDLAAAGTNTGDSWNIISVTTSSYDGSFQVSGFTNSGGTWTGVTNGVTYQFVQSTGILSIPGAGPTNAYGQWLTNYPSLTGTNTNAAADPDGDGFANSSEFAFGGNPTVGSPALMASQKAGTNANISFIAATSAVTYVVKGTTNLATGPWTNATVTLSNAPDQSGVLLTNYVRRQFTVPAAGNAFYKVEAAY